MDCWQVACGISENKGSVVLSVAVLRRHMGMGNRKHNNDIVRAMALILMEIRPWPINL